jgi:hypothetical protein
MNLLVAGLYPSMAIETARQIGIFHFNQFLVAVPIHLTISLLVGLLYGAMLPMLPRHPILLGGFLAPLLWSGLIYGELAFVKSGAWLDNTEVGRVCRHVAIGLCPEIQ